MDTSVVDRFARNVQLNRKQPDDGEDALLNFIRQSIGLFQRRERLESIDDGASMFAMFSPENIISRGDEQLTMMGSVSFAFQKKDGQINYSYAREVKVEDFDSLPTMDLLKLALSEPAFKVPNSMFLDNKSVNVINAKSYAFEGKENTANHKTYKLFEKLPINKKETSLYRNISDRKEYIQSKLLNESSFQFDFSQLFNMAFYEQFESANQIDCEDLLNSISSTLDGDQLYFSQFVKSKFIEKKLSALGVNDARLHPTKSPLPLLNFILSSESPEQAKYRKEFFEVTYKLLAGKDLQSWGDIDTRMENIFDGIFSLDKNKKSTTATDLIINSINNGKYPMVEISTGLGVPSMKKKQFQRAMYILGEHKRGIESRNNPFSKGFDFRPSTAKGVFCVSKLPEEWLLTTPGGVNALTDEGGKFLSERMQGKQKEFIHKLLPYLVEAGVKIDSFSTKGDKASLKELSKQWSWLSNGNKGLLDKITAFDQKYNVNATFDDYSKILADTLDSVFKRIVKSNNNIDMSDVFTVEEQELKVNEEMVSTLILKHLDEETLLEDKPDDWDEEIDGDYEPLLPSEYMAPLYLPEKYSISRLCKESSASFKEVALLSDKLHKNYSNFLKQANSNSELDFEWAKITDNPFYLDGGFVVDTVSTRLQLLEEGEVMGHCVFSYLNECLSGESVILSIKNKDGDRIATAELSLEEGEESGVEISIVQCLGKQNAVTSDVRLIERGLEDWVDKVHKGEVAVNYEKIMNNENRDDIFIDAEDKPMDKGDVLCSIPYSGDGAYLSYFYFNKYTPSNLSIDNIIESQPLLYEAYEQSSFSKEIKIIKDIAIRWNCPPEDVVNYKINNEIDSLISLNNHFKERVEIVKTLDSIVKNNDGVLSAVQIQNQCQDALKNNGLYIDFSLIKSNFMSNDFDWNKEIRPIATSPDIEDVTSFSSPRLLQNKIA